MKKIVIVALHCVFVLWLGWAGSAVGIESADTTEYLTNLELTVPDNEFCRNYLGLTGKPGESFTPAEIQADILLIELFSMYCPYCQEAAPIVNELYRKMEEVSPNGPIVKIIGLGVSNSQFEVEHFKEMYDIPFPLFPDRYKSMYKALGGGGTPTFIGYRLEDGKEATIVLRNAGSFHSSDDFLKELITKAGL
jgi:thiol-disulfide isomerase/thioredoxin